MHRASRLRFILGLIVGIGLVATIFMVLSTPGDASDPASTYNLVSTTFLTDGGRVEWSHDGEWIYYDRKEGDGFWEVYRIRPDGTEKECLTCTHPNLPSRHKGQPEAHPKGRFLIFQAEKNIHRRPFYSALPGGGTYNDLYAMDLESENHDVYRLTNVPRWMYSGSLHAQFNRTGTRLLWGDLQGWGGRYGNWQMAVADFVVDPEPRLENRRYYDPGPQPIWLEAHAWAPDDSAIYITCTPVAGMDDNNMDICRMDFDNPTEVTRLTFTSGLGEEADSWDEHTKMAPLNDVLTWVSSLGFGTQPNNYYPLWLHTELWIMNLDGSGKRQLTNFNDTKPTVVRDHAWNPSLTGTRQQMVASVFDQDLKSAEVWIFEFEVGASEASE